MDDRKAIADEFRAVPVEGDRERLAAILHDNWTCRSGHDRVPYPCDTLAAILTHRGVSLTGSGLDVERLARAQVRSGIDTFLPGEDRWISANEAQAAIAREYAALSGESGEPHR